MRTVKVDTRDDGIISIAVSSDVDWGDGANTGVSANCKMDLARC